MQNKFKNASRLRTLFRDNNRTVKTPLEINICLSNMEYFTMANCGDLDELSNPNKIVSTKGN